MICTKCNNQGILNTALDLQFYYCRTCKEEILPQFATTSKIDPFKLRKSWPKLFKSTISSPDDECSYWQAVPTEHDNTLYTLVLIYPEYLDSLCDIGTIDSGVYSMEGLLTNTWIEEVL